MLYLPVDEFDLLLDFFEEFLEASLLKDRLGTLQVVFGLLGLRRVADHEQSSNDLESLGDVYRAVSMQCILKLLYRDIKSLVNVLDKAIRE